MGIEERRLTFKEMIYEFLYDYGFWLLLLIAMISGMIYFGAFNK